jgi:small subunit ribosomal protein S20
LANSKSAEKRARTNERRRIRNRRYRSATRTLVRRAEALIAPAEAEAAAGAVTNAVSLLDRAAAKGIIHPNNAARRKSRLMAKYNKLASAS